VSRTFRDAVLSLARQHPFARRLVNSGRLSVPAVLADSPLNTPDTAAFEGAMVPGTVASDAPVAGARGPWLLDYLGGDFGLLAFGDGVDAAAARALRDGAIPCRVVQVGGAAGADRDVVADAQELVAARYDGRPGTCYLVRPDQHVCARWRAFDAAAVRAALARATCRPPEA
jgi:3-(3-hydroxy-phenyl)propionate hydroxylase